MPITTNKLENFVEIKSYFETQTRDYFFISPTNFNLINMHNWVNTWQNINFIDCFDGQSPNVKLPSYLNIPPYHSLEEINQYLLSDETAISDITSHNAEALFLFFNKDIEARCEALGVNINLPENALVKHIDNKITTTQLGNKAGVASVPNALAHIDSYQTLCDVAKSHHLGDKLVVQTAYGDSGKTTFFISTEADYEAVAAKIECEDTVKIMKHITCKGTAIEGCATKQGTYVGPLLGELIGFEALTPYKGGWCGNELYDECFSHKIRKDIHQKTEALGNVLYEQGYRGYFEVDYLIDLDDDSVYLGELNPRITGITAMTNMSPFCQRTVPLFLFHLLEYQSADIGLQPAEYNALSLEHGAQGVSSQMIIKHTQEQLKIVEQAPVSGVYTLDKDGQLELVKASDNPEDKGDNTQHIYLLRVLNASEYSYKSADLAIVFLNEKITSNKGTVLNNTAHNWINAVRSSFTLRDLTQEEQALVEQYNSPTQATKGSDA